MARYAQLGSSCSEHEDMQGIGGNDAAFGAPRTLKALDNVNAVHVACGALFTMAVTAAGELYTWGWGGGGALGACCVRRERQHVSESPETSCIDVDCCMRAQDTGAAATACNQ